jgi:hypothetical protein
VDSAPVHANDPDIDLHQVEVGYYAYDKLILRHHDGESGSSHEHANVWGIVRIPVAVESEADHIDGYVSLTPHNHADVLGNAPAHANVQGIAHL